MQYGRTAFGANPNAGVNANDDHGWGGYQWPGGVPAALLATLRFAGKLGTVTLVGRKELMPLVGVLMTVTEQKFGYLFHPGWCWSYENRAVTGSTSTPSNHSRGKAFDFNAPNNPYSWTWQCDIPPAVIQLWESHSFYWGGRYTGQPTDPMHLEYCGTPASVAGNLASAQAILGAHAEAPSPVPPTPAPAPAPKPALSRATITAPGVTARRVQILLCAAGYQIGVDNIIGDATTAGVRWIQAKAGLTPDLIVGPKTLAALAAVAGARYPLADPQVFGTYSKIYAGQNWSAKTRSGRGGNDNAAIRASIRLIQQMEQERGWAPTFASAPDWADGYYDPPTDTATAAAQRALGLTADGMVGRRTWSGLMA